MDEILSRAGGSTFAEISKKGFRPIPCVLPQQEVMSAYDETAKLIVDSVTANERESRTLAELRDLLLPKLLSGEIRVKDAEKAVEAAI
jgi:type I restriction enzyme S subunit